MFIIISRRYFVLVHEASLVAVWMLHIWLNTRTNYSIELNVFKPMLHALYNDPHRILDTWLPTVHIVTSVFVNTSTAPGLTHTNFDLNGAGPKTSGWKTVNARGSKTRISAFREKKKNMRSKGVSWLQVLWDNFNNFSKCLQFTLPNKRSTYDSTWRKCFHII